MRKNKFLAGVMLAGWLALAVAPLAMVQGCAAISGIFQSDPVGASLKTTKDTYEASVKTAGRLYVAGIVSEPQIRKFRDEANKFHKAYTELTTIHEVQGVKEGDVKLAQVGKLLDVLVAMVATFSSQGVK